MSYRARRRRIAIATLAVVAVGLGAAPVGAVDEDPDVPLTAGVTEDDFYRPPSEGRLPAATGADASNDVVQHQPPLAAQYVAQSVEFTGDPLGIVVYPLESRRYSLGSDKIGVYICTWAGATGTAELAAVTATLNGAVRDYFVALSGGRYTPVFTARQTVTIATDNEFDCVDGIEASNPVSTDNGILAVLNNQSNGGLATSGWFCDIPCDSSVTPNTFPANNRWAVVDGGSVSTPDFVPPYDEPHLTTAVHEIGHTLGWPHSYSAETFNEYDNPIDVMSGNMTEDLFGRTDTPYGTNAFNRYRAGWFDPSQVLVYTGGVQTITIAPAGGVGLQMVAMPTEVEWSFITLDARRSVGVDAIPDSFQGVTSHYVEQICPFGVCWGTAAGLFSYPPSPDSLGHVTVPGGTLAIDYEGGAPAIADGTLVKVLSGSDAGYVVKLVGFADVGSSTFLGDILWLADEGITKGCNDTSYCPGGNVTRGQMAAFLVRALGLTDSDPAIDFVDDDASIFEADIEKLATAGITRGCNPPANDRFCPDQPVSRGQMAAFLVRAFGLTDLGSVDFADDDASVFESDIEKLATAGITKGCNPPSNTEFCPGQSVSRGQMAAFLHRSEVYLP
jgi:hypothetical protein